MREAKDWKSKVKINGFSVVLCMCMNVIEFNIQYELFFKKKRKTKNGTWFVHYNVQLNVIELQIRGEMVAPPCHHLSFSDFVAWELANQQ